MLIQILTHTPLYVWAILAFLVYRGVAAMRDRDIAIRKLFIIPVVMLALSLQDIAAKFGLGALTLGAWTTAAAAAMLLVWKFGSARVTAGPAPGTVRVRGSVIPFALMMAIFLTKYATAVTLAMQAPATRHVLFSAVVCAVFGVFNGVFMGALLRDVLSLQAGRAAAPAAAPAAVSRTAGAGMAV